MRLERIANIDAASGHCNVHSFLPSTVEIIPMLPNPAQIARPFSLITADHMHLV
jgi:hypothetical protein